MTAPTEIRTPPPPTFPYKAYGVSLTWMGDEGEIMAEGHVPLVRFIAACNHMARKDAHIRNIMDSDDATLEGALYGAKHCWVLPVHDPGNEWCVKFNATAETPGAIPVTIWEWT